MGDRIAVMNKGRIVQLGNPLEVYDNPADTFVGGFIGNPPMNFLEAEVVGERRGSARRREAQRRLARADGRDGCARGAQPPARNPRRGDRRRDLRPPTGSCGRRSIVLEPLGSHNLLTVRCGDDTLKVSVRPTCSRRRTATSGCVSSRPASAGWTATRERRSTRARSSSRPTQPSSRREAGAAAAVTALPSVIVDPHFRAMGDIFSAVTWSGSTRPWTSSGAGTSRCLSTGFARRCPARPRSSAAGGATGRARGGGEPARDPHRLRRLAAGARLRALLRAQDPRALGGAGVRRRRGGDGARPGARVLP